MPKITVQGQANAKWLIEHQGEELRVTYTGYNQIRHAMAELRRLHPHLRDLQLNLKTLKPEEECETNERGTRIDHFLVLGVKPRVQKLAELPIEERLAREDAEDRRRVDEQCGFHGHFHLDGTWFAPRSAPEALPTREDLANLRQLRLMLFDGDIPSAAEIEQSTQAKTGEAICFACAWNREHGYEPQAQTREEWRNIGCGHKGTNTFFDEWMAQNARSAQGD